MSEKIPNPQNIINKSESRGSVEVNTIENITQKIKDKFKEIGILTGIFTATEREGEIQRRADFKIRDLFYNFLGQIEDINDLPEFILFSENESERRYFLPRAKEIYTISSRDGQSEADKDQRFLPGSSKYAGQEIVNYLIRQNLKTQRPLAGLKLTSAKPRYSEEQVTKKMSDGEFRLSDYNNFEALRISEIQIILDEIKRTLKNSKNVELLNNTRHTQSEIRLQQTVEQQAAEEKSVTELKKIFTDLINFLKKRGIELPNDFPLYSDDYGDEALNKLSKELRKLRTKEMEPRKSFHFQPNGCVLEVANIKERSVFRKERIDKSSRRLATFKEYLKHRDAILQAILNYNK